MLKGLSDEALSQLGDLLAQEPGLRAAAASREAFSAVLHAWLLDACSVEQGERRGETHEALLAPALAGDELIRARTYACALALMYSHTAKNIPTTVTPANRERYKRLAAELEAAMLKLAEALSALQELTSQPGAVH